jgi:GNAT superfamily N-acetyltransferase
MILIRKAEPADMDALQTLFAQIWSTADWLPAALRSQADLRAESVGETLFMASDEAGRVLGFVAIQEEEPYIHHLYVAEQARRLGVGKALLDSLQGYLPWPWQLKCLIDNKSALAFYERLGWKTVGSGNSGDGAYVLLQLTDRP